MNKIRVAMYQRLFTHYRRAIFRALATHPLLDFTLIHGQNDVGELRNVRDDPIVHCVSGPTKSLPFANGAAYIMPHAVEYAKSGEYDVMIIPNDLYCPSVWQIYRIARKRKKGVAIFSIGFPQYKQWLRDKIRIWFACKVDSVILYSYQHRNRFIQSGVPAEHIYVAPNAVDVTSIKAAEEKMTARKLKQFKSRHGLTETCNIIHAGRMVPIKQLHLLLRAAAILMKDGSRIKLILIGAGPMVNEWRLLAQKLGIADSILWPGEVLEHDELCYWFHSSDICVAPGQQGLIANLSHAYGVPLITSDSPRWQGPEIQVFKNGQTGLLYKYGNVQDLAGKIKLLADDPERRKNMGTLAKQTILREFTIDRMCKGFVDGIKHAMARD